MGSVQHLGVTVALTTSREHVSVLSFCQIMMRLNSCVLVHQPLHLSVKTPAVTQRSDSDLVIGSKKETLQPISVVQKSHVLHRKHPEGNKKTPQEPDVVFVSLQPVMTSAPVS